MGRAGITMLFFSMPALGHAYNGECQTPQDVVELPPGHWCEVPGSNALQVEKQPDEWDDWNGTSSAKYESYQGVNDIDFAGIMGAWSGGALDSLRDQLLIFGGGHEAYAGNEILAFSLTTLSWSRITDPTPFPTPDTEGARNPGPPATPTSRHSYGGLAYLAHIDRLFLYGGSGAPNGWGMLGTWTFDLGSVIAEQPAQNSSCWEERSSVNEPGTTLEDKAYYDPVTGRVFKRRHTTPGRLSSYDFDTDTWTLHADSGATLTTFGVVIPARRKLFEFNVYGSGDVRIWDIPDQIPGESSMPLSYTDVVTGGDDEIEDWRVPGVTYEPTLGKIVAYKGGTSLYLFDPDTNNWTVQPAAPGNLADPGPSTASGGIYGRFQYSARLNLFVFVDSVDSNVFLFRLAVGDDVAPSAPTGLQVE